jgi:hypothetical protein
MSPQKTKRRNVKSGAARAADDFGYVGSVDDLPDQGARQSLLDLVVVGPVGL